MSVNQIKNVLNRSKSVKFRYSLACPTLAWMGYSVVEDPEPVLQAIRDAGYRGADLPAEGLDGGNRTPHSPVVWT